MTNFAIIPPEASKIAPQVDALLVFMTLVSLVGPGAGGLLVTASRSCTGATEPGGDADRGLDAAGGDLDDYSAGLFLVMFVWGSVLYFRIYTPPPNAMNIYVVGKQWMWKAEHPGGQHEINSLHVPIGKPIQLTLISQDVFHSFSIPAFRVKREAIPGRYTTVWFEATTPGKYHLFCTQYCGTQHSGMVGEIVVHDAGGLQEVAGELDQRMFAGAERRAAVCQPGLQRVPQRRSRMRAGRVLANVYGSKLTLTTGSRCWWMKRSCGRRF